MARAHGLDRAAYWWLALSACLGLIFFLSTRPHLQSPIRFPLGDKAAHLVEYALLGFLARGALRRSGIGGGSRLGRWRVPLFWGGGVAVALVDEWVQAHVPGRESALSDLLADAAGIGLGQWVEGRLSRGRRGQRASGAKEGGDDGER